MTRLYWARYAFLAALVGTVGLLGWMTFCRNRR
jgi:hypothetical protein